MSIINISNNDLQDNTLNGLLQKVHDVADKALDGVDVNSNGTREPATLGLIFSGISAAAAVVGTGTTAAMSIESLINKPKGVLGDEKTRLIRLQVTSRKWCLLRLTVGVQSVPMFISPNVDIDVSLKVVIYNDGDRLSEVCVSYFEIGSDEQLIRFIDDFKPDAAGNMGSIENSYLNAGDAHVLVDNSGKTPLIMSNQDRNDIYNF